jgi:transposase-like protein
MSEPSAARQRKGASRYSAEFRANALARAAESGTSIAAVAAEVGVSPSTLRRWVRDAAEPAQPQPEPTSDAPVERTDTVPAEPAVPPLPAEPTEPAEAADPRPFAQRIEEEWPDWRSFDWPVLPAVPPEPSKPAPPRVHDQTRPDQTRPDQTRPDQTRRDPTRAQPPGPPTASSARTPRPPERHADDVFALASRVSTRRRLVIVVLGFLAAVFVSQFVPADYPLRPVAVALHVVSLVASLGAVLLVDWHGLLWLAGQRRLAESTRLAAAASPIIWLGLAGLVVTGALLRPAIDAPLTLLKLALVLAVAVNGAVMSPVRRRLADLAEYASRADVPARDWRRMMGATLVSQVGWWGAVVIGFINSST